MRRPNGNTESVDNYLKAILTLSGAEDARVPSSALADRLGVAPASVTNMLQKLARAGEPAVLYERHRGVRLSAAGRSRALEVLRHHRLLETFLYKVLDYPLAEVHAEAERLEHFISERFEERIAAKLGHPAFDPHGHCIPTLEGQLPVQSAMTLAEVTQAGDCVVSSVADHDPAALAKLEELGIRPGARLHFQASGPAAALQVEIASRAEPVSVSRALAAEIGITLLPETGA